MIESKYRIGGWGGRGVSSSNGKRMLMKFFRTFGTSISDIMIKLNDHTELFNILLHWN